MDQHIMHEQHDAIILSLSAIAVMADHPYTYWQRMCEHAARSVGTPDEVFFKENAERCEKVLRRACELIDEVMQFIGDANNAVDAVDDHGFTDAAFAQMDRALGRRRDEDDSGGAK